MNDRIKMVRMSQTPKLSQEAFGKRIGVTGAAISRLESGDRSVTDQIIKSICHEFNVSESWLRTGEGDMYVPKTRDEEISEFVEKVMSAEPDDIRVRLISVMSRLTAEDWAFIAKRAEDLKDEMEQSQNKKTPLAMAARGGKVAPPQEPIDEKEFEEAMRSIEPTKSL